MSQTELNKIAKNNELVVEAFGAFFNQRDHTEQLSTICCTITSSIVLTSRAALECLFSRDGLSAMKLYQ